MFFKILSQSFNLYSAFIQGLSPELTLQITQDVKILLLCHVNHSLSFPLLAVLDMSGKYVGHESLYALAYSAMVLISFDYHRRTFNCIDIAKSRYKESRSKGYPPATDLKTWSFHVNFFYFLYWQKGVSFSG